MSYVYREDAVSTMLSEMRDAGNAISSGLESVSNSSKAIANRSDWQGNKADAMKGYMTNVHGAIISSIAVLMKDLYDQALLYQKGYKEIDYAPHAVIPGSELEELKSRINEMAPVFDSLDIEAQRIIQSIAQIGTIPYVGINDLPQTMNTLADKLELLDADISSHESAYQGRFSAEKTMVSNLRAMISEARGMKMDAYSNQALANSKNYQNLVASYQELMEAIASNAAEVEVAEAMFQETCVFLEEERLYQERVKAAESAKFWTGVLTAVVSAVVITATGGTGVVIVGAVAGAINAGVGSIADQTVGTIGCPGRVDWGRVVLDTTVGGVIGGVTSAVSAGFGNAAKNLSTLGKIGTEGLKSVSVGMIERGGNTYYQSRMSGKSIKESLSDSASATFDPNKIAGDLAGGCAGKAVSIAGEKGFDKLGNKIFDNKSTIKPYENAIQRTKVKSPFLHQAYDVVSETVTETGKGITKRFAGTFAETRDLGKAADSAIDSKSIMSDVLTTSGAKTATTVTADIKTHMVERMNKAQKQIDRVQDQVHEDTLKHNNGSDKGKGGNRTVCEEKGIPRNEWGTPDYKDTDYMAAETEVEQVAADPSKVKYTKAASSGQDYRNVYDQMVAEKKIDPNEYRWDDGNVIRTQTVMVDGKPTTVETKYTVHHVDYDVNTGKGRFQLVETEYHKGITHEGGAYQADAAYNKYNVGSYIDDYNEAVSDANDMSDASFKAYKYAKQGGQSGAKVSITPDKNPSLDTIDWRTLFPVTTGG